MVRSSVLYMVEDKAFGGVEDSREAIVKDGKADDHGVVCEVHGVRKAEAELAGCRQTQTLFARVSAQMVPNVNCVECTLVNCEVGICEGIWG
jgi:hypothetical protein